ncbi:MAG: hypothetical protein PHQ34_15280 [Methanothrix sp.]|nr:hypothetical protein [Methanothrix sp.]
MAPRFLRPTGFLSSAARASMVDFLACERAPARWWPSAKAYAGVAVLWGELQAHRLPSAGLGHYGTAPRRSSATPGGGRRRRCK